MRDEAHGTETSPTPSQRGRRRRTLANITNLSLSASWTSDGAGRLKSASGKKSSGGGQREAELLDEIAELKVLLAEKEAARVGQLEQMQRESSARLDQMQRDYVAQLRRHAQVNEELIVYNSRVCKDAGQARDQLKLLQHEFSQMTVVYRLSKSEMQAKLAESEELVARLLPRSPAADRAGPKGSARPRRSASAHRRSSQAQHHQLLAEDDCAPSTRIDKEGANKRSSDVGRRPILRAKRTAQPEQQQQPAHSSNSAQESTATATAPLCRVLQHPNLYGDLVGLEPMLENICEDETPRISSTSASGSNTGDDSCRSDGSDLTTAAPPPTATAAAPAAPAAPPRRVTSRSMSKVAIQRVGPPAAAAASASSSDAASAPHFSRRVPCSSISTTISSTGNCSNAVGSGRPVRKAVEKVTSYVEPPLKIKMRRPF